MVSSLLNVMVCFSSKNQFISANILDDKERLSKKLQHPKRLSKILKDNFISKFLARMLGKFRKYSLVSDWMAWSNEN